jgi:hypothetical protein
VTEREAAEWLEGFKAFQAARGRMIMLLQIPRPGEPHTDETNLATYWSPAEVRALFQRALDENGVTEETAKELIQLGSAGRLRTLATACQLHGITAAGRAKFGDLENPPPPPDFWQWIEICFTSA